MRAEPMNTTKTKRKPTKERAALEALPPAADDRVYMAIGPNCWGRGRTGQEAVKNARREFPSYNGKWRYILYDAPKGSWVDDIDGGLQWEWDATKGEPEPAPARLLYRHNMEEKKK